MGNPWFRKWLVSGLAPNHYLNYVLVVPNLWSSKMAKNSKRRGNKDKNQLHIPFLTKQECMCQYVLMWELWVSHIIIQCFINLCYGKCISTSSNISMPHGISGTSDNCERDSNIRHRVLINISRVYDFCQNSHVRTGSTRFESRCLLAIVFLTLCFNYCAGKQCPRGGGGGGGGGGEVS